MLKSNLTRRAVVASIAAAPVAMLPASIAAASPPAAADDGEAVVLWHHFLAARAECDRRTAEFGKAVDAAKAEAPPIPRELVVPNPQNYLAMTEVALRQHRPAGPELERVVAMSDAWFAEWRQVEARHGVHGADERLTEACDRLFQVEHALEAIEPDTIVRIGVKLAMARLLAIDENGYEIGTALPETVDELIRHAGLDLDAGYFTGMEPRSRWANGRDDGEAEAVRVA